MQKTTIEKDFKAHETILTNNYSLRSIDYTGNDECGANLNSTRIFNTKSKLMYDEFPARDEFTVLLKDKLWITNYLTCLCCCSFSGKRFYFLLKNKVLLFDANRSSYNFYWSVDEKCNLQFEKIKYSEKDSILYLYSLFPDCVQESNPYDIHSSIVKFKDYTNELFIAVKILEDDVQIKRFFDKSIPKEYLKSYEEAELIKD